MTLLQTSTSTPLSTLVREGSKAEHEAAESSSFMSELLAGRVNAAGYAHYLSLLLRVYEAIESTGRALADDPIASAVLDPALERRVSIATDLEHWSGGDPVEHASPAADAYVERVRASAAWGGLFVAHHYTRYLGDLSGGQAIGRILAREFDLAEGEGVAFYAFPAIPKPKPYKDAYRARLDAMPLDDAQKARVLDEVKAVFAFNGALFSELTGHLDRYRR